MKPIFLLPSLLGFFEAYGMVTTSKVLLAWYFFGDVWDNQNDNHHFCFETCCTNAFPFFEDKFRDNIPFLVMNVVDLESSIQTFIFVSMPIFCLEDLDL